MCLDQLPHCPTSLIFLRTHALRPRRRTRTVCAVWNLAAEDPPARVRCQPTTTTTSSDTWPARSHNRPSRCRLNHSSCRCSLSNSPHRCPSSKLLYLSSTSSLRPLPQHSNRIPRQMMPWLPRTSLVTTVLTATGSAALRLVLARVLWALQHTVATSKMRLCLSRRQHAPSTHRSPVTAGSRRRRPCRLLTPRPFPQQHQLAMSHLAPRQAVCVPAQSRRRTAQSELAPWETPGADSVALRAAVRTRPGTFSRLLSGMTQI